MVKSNFLHRQVRKHFRHGKSHTKNQFIVRSDKYASEIVGGTLVITIRVAKKYGSYIARLDDCDISRFTPYRQVRQILLARSPAQLSVKRLELGEPSRQPSADKSGKV